MIKRRPIGPDRKQLRRSFEFLSRELKALLPLLWSVIHQWFFSPGGFCFDSGVMLNTRTEKDGSGTTVLRSFVRNGM